MLLESSNVNSWILPAIFLCLFVVLVVFNFIKGRNSRNYEDEMLKKLKVGDVVLTKGGVIGRILEIKETVSMIMVVLETGADSNKSVVSFAIGAIYGPIDITPAVYDENGNLINSVTKEIVKPVAPVKEEKKISEKSSTVSNDVVDAVEKKKTTKSKSTGETKSKKTEKSSDVELTDKSDKTVESASAEVDLFDAPENKVNEPKQTKKRSKKTKAE